MKLHAAAMEKLIAIMNTYGGSPDEVKVKRMIQDIDFTPYERKTTDNQEMILVLTDDYVKALNVKQQ